MRGFIRGCVKGCMRMSRCAPGFGLPLTVIIVAALSSRPGLAIPAWARTGGQKLTGSIYDVICSGRGPDLDLARNEAMRACASFAARQVPGSLRVRSLTVESERSVGFHEELAESLKLTGLICRPRREEVEESRGELTLWLQCEYDLSRARVTDLGADHAGDAPVRGERPDNEARRLIAMATVPRCDSILVRGAHPRVVECDGDPVSLVIEPEDRQLIVRARDYQPESLSVSRLEAAPGEKKSDVVQVLLNPM